MSTFRKYKEIKSVLTEFPGVRTHKEFDLLIEIGYHQEQGCPLTLKQLQLLEIASQATVRRYLANMVRNKMVEKAVLDTDHRSVILKLSNSTIRMMTNHLARIVEHLRALQNVVSGKPRSKKSKA